MTREEFENNGVVFSALRSAEKYLKDKGYSVGPMCGDEPIGFLRGDYNIMKWRNLSESDRFQLDGKIISDNFRDGNVRIIHNIK